MDRRHGAWWPCSIRRLGSCHCGCESLRCHDTLPDPLLSAFELRRGEEPTLWVDDDALVIGQVRRQQSNLCECTHPARAATDKDGRHPAPTDVYRRQREQFSLEDVSELRPVLVPDD